jgi:hypothetical protein
MHNALAQFQENLRRVRELGELASAVQSIITAAIDVSDILRAQIVLAVSALDNLIHEVARLGMVEASKGLRTKTDAYLRFQLPIAALENGLPFETSVGEAVREKHSWQSFQDPDKIADVIRLISSVQLWDAVGGELGIPPQDVKTRLKLIVDRRNKIAHEADMDPANPGFRWPITKQLVNDAVDFIEQVCTAICKVAV